MLYVGEGPRGSHGACSTLCWISVTPSTTHNQIGPLWCWLLSGWACAHCRPLWVSPATSPVRLGVSPAAAPTPAVVFTQRFEALFHRAGALGYAVCFATRCLSGLSMCECGAAGSASGQTACPVRPTLRQSWSPVSVLPRQLESSPPRLPVSTPRTGLDECLFFISLVSDFLAVPFSVSSGCVRRCSVSTYAAILVLPKAPPFQRKS